MAGQKSGRSLLFPALAPISLALVCHLPTKSCRTCTVVYMQRDISPADRKLILQLGIITQEIGLKQHDLNLMRQEQKALIVDLVHRDIISLARAARIAEVQRQTATNWVKSWPGEETRV